MPEPFSLTDDQIQRYSRQILLKEVGGTGMAKLLDATVGVIGAGGLGCPAIQVLAATGVGYLKVIDGDIVDLSNLPRQFLHYTPDVGIPKVDSIAAKVAAMNPDVQVENIQAFLTQDNAADFLSGCDYIIEASDNHATKFLVNDACVHFRIPFVVAGVVQYYGQIVSVLPGESACYRCIFHEPVPQDSIPTCSGTGVLSTAPAIAGVLQAHEAIQSILGIPSKILNQLFSFDLLGRTFEHISVKQDPTCLACAHPEEPFYLTAEYGVARDECQI